MERLTGNKSIKGDNWIGGPSHNAAPQHIPGYLGYIPGMNAENVHGKRYAENTGKILSSNVDKGAFPTNLQRFKTSSGEAHGIAQHRVNKNQCVDPCESRDLQAAGEWHNAE